MILAIITILFSVYALTVELPRYNPDRTLELEERIQAFFQKITLPIKIARLLDEKPDEKILIPVYGVEKLDIEDTWGAARGDRGERPHEGQDIFAPRGTPIFAAADGYVTRVTDQTVGGNSIFIVGRGGRTYYYTHLNSFANNLREGQFVTTDTVIGFVGNSGNAATTPTHLHFGIYEFKGEAINPYPMLTDRVQGSAANR